ncbi:NAD(P)-dependent oxidoreductase [Alsobacter metallidurans]|uniref:NAD(P)-dependent oxidoreductase n=1 Tax=Alsobacter metallidurans TaxID=340221 RepID=A0A917MIT9_9HYPH|nr:SAF domain-containing protein [Alsobacter metallidurans]GGH13209.1 NAD(P)-dependent oxidoreductase [Alsobacter metallidurans]
MIIVDKALARREAQNRPVKVGMVGTGVQGRAITRTIVNSTPGMRMSVIANRTIEHAERAFSELGLTAVRCETVAALQDALANDRPAVTSNPLLLGQASGLDAVIEATGTMEYAARAVLAAIQGGKHVVMVNAELDGTVGPILKKKADTAGVVYTAGDGDQPGAQMNLVRFVQGIGLKVVLCGNMKGLYDPYRNPKTQESFAAKWGLDPAMVASFADGTKISFEQAVIANGLGMKVAKRGMLGVDVSEGNPYKPLVPLDQTVEGFHAALDAHLAAGGPGIVDYVMGAAPGPGIFVLATCDDPAQKHFLNYYKMGPGPYYTFYTPYHLCHFEVPGCVARAVLFEDATVTPLDGPSVGVIALAKKDLQPGDLIDQLGGFEVYGMLENIETVRAENLIPIGLAVGSRVTRFIPKDQPLTFADVTPPEDRLVDKLYAEQEAMFSSERSPEGRRP